MLFIYTENEDDVSPIELEEVVAPEGGEDAVNVKIKPIEFEDDSTVEYDIIVPEKLVVYYIICTI